MNTTQHFDLIISGGGMVGLALAAASQQLGLRCAVIEQGVTTIATLTPDTFSSRVSALNLASERLLTRLGAWQLIPENRKTAYQEMAVWDGLGGSRIHFSAQDVQERHLGHIIENNCITDALWQVILEKRNIDVLTNDQIINWQPNESGVTVTTQQGHQMTSAVLAGCEGKHSLVRQLSQIKQWQWDYQHRAIVATVFHEKPHLNTARQVFLDTGPLAFLPLTCETPNTFASSIVWSAKTSKADALLAADDTQFIDELNQAIEGRYGNITSVTERTTFDLKASQAKTYVDGRAVILGDAAHTIHPLAGLGVNLGFLDAATLAESLGQAKAKQLDCGHAFVLRRYQRQRQSHNLVVAGLMDGLKRLYDTQRPTPVILRNLGLEFINNNGLIKRPLIKGALGDFGTPLPELCK